MYPQHSRPTINPSEFPTAPKSGPHAKEINLLKPRLRVKRRVSFLRIAPDSSVEIAQTKEEQNRTLRDVSYEVIKGCFDLVASTILLVLASPIMLIIACLIKMTSPGPVIFRQRRLTKSGKEFTMYKFRSMRVDAEAKIGAVWAAKDDPRVTAVGSLLRVTRLDELPQLVNVIAGDMSIIGPRPERPELALNLASEIPSFHRRLAVKAGLTGLAQVGNGYASSTDAHRKKLAWDRLYIRRRCLWLDTTILVRTIWVVLTRRGAR